MKKKIVSLMLVGICGLSIMGCEQPKDSVNRESNSTSDNRFVNTGDTYIVNGDKYNVFYDKNTNIVYLLLNSGLGYSQSNAITPFIGKDKLPMTLEEYNKSK